MTRGIVEAPCVGSLRIPSSRDGCSAGREGTATWRDAKGQMGGEAGARQAVGSSARYNALSLLAGGVATGRPASVTGATTRKRARVSGRQSRFWKSERRPSERVVDGPGDDAACRPINSGDLAASRARRSRGGIDASGKSFDDGGAGRCTLTGLKP